MVEVGIKPRIEDTAMASVLVIEDSTLELYRYVSFLKKLDHDVTGISSLAEAKHIFSAAILRLRDHGPPSKHR